ncbi:MAG: 50S ribosomal protein L11 methyltransferase [Myxococcota bacterium]
MEEQTTSPNTASARVQVFSVRAPDRACAERALAEAFAEGAAGAEEDEDGCMLRLYVPASCVGAVQDALRNQVPEVIVGSAEELQERDWSEAWKEGLAPIDVSPRLRIRSSFETSPPAPGQQELVIDPGQAFGTGGHESTALALAALDRLYAEGTGPAHVLDVGAGTGVLALAALRLGAVSAVGFDLDPLAAPACRENALENGLAAGAVWFTGPLEALAPQRRFDAVVANLLRRELEPIFADVAARLDPGAPLVLSGLLDSDAPRVAAWAEAAGLEADGRVEAVDASGVTWVALLWRRPTPARG